MSDPDEVIVRRTYTGARRYVQVVRWIMGYQLPVALQAAQFVTGAGTLVLLIQTRPTWGSSLSWWIQIAIIIVLPVAVAIATRYLRTDGTGPAAVLVGLLSLATAPARGRRNGTTVAVPRAHRAPSAYSLRCDLAELPVPALMTWPGPTTLTAHPRSVTTIGPWRENTTPPATHPPAPAAHTATPAGHHQPPGETPLPRATPTRRSSALSVAEVTRAAQALANGHFSQPPADTPHDPSPPRATRP